MEVNYTNPTDKVGALACFLQMRRIPAYYPNEPIESAWRRFFMALIPFIKLQILCNMPQPHTDSKRYPTWAEMMSYPNIPKLSDHELQPDVPHMYNTCRGFPTLKIWAIRDNMSRKVFCCVDPDDYGFSRPRGDVCL